MIEPGTRGHHQAFSQKTIILLYIIYYISVEACVSMKSLKYLYKYVYKGHDAANIQLQLVTNYDEISMYEDASYVSPPEAF